MAYQTGTASSIEDLMQQLHDFAVANGWTSDIMSTTNDWMAINNGSVFVQFRWDNTNAFACFHSRGFSGTGVAPGNHTGDDGCGTVDSTAPYNATITSGRRVADIGAGPFVAYHFFTNGTTQYVHCVLEFTAGQFAHWSFGTIDKIGTWTGGEYCVAHSQRSTTYSANVMMFGSAGGVQTTAAANLNGSLHIEGMPNQSGGMQWLLFSTQTSSIGNDRAGNARITSPGGWRDFNPWLSAFGYVRASELNGFLPLIPVPIWWRNTAPTPSQYMLLGFAPGLYLIQMANFNPGDEFTIGTDTFKVFPPVAKSAGTNFSRYAGVAYRKIV